jgi:hypothetical protein
MKHKTKLYSIVARAIACSATLVLTLAQAQTIIPESVALPASALDTTKPGFLVRVVQATGPALATTIARAEDQLAGFLINPATGQPFANIIDPFGFNADGTYDEAFFVSYSSQFFPGIPGTEGTVLNIALEAITFVDLQPGTYTMVVNSDDGFRVTTGNVFDRLSEIVLGEFDGGRAAADTVFSFTITQAGVYPFRLIYMQGGGGFNVDWFMSSDPAERIYLNDSGGIPSYRALRPGAVISGPSISAVSPLPNAVNASPSAGLSALIKDGTSPLNPASVHLFHNDVDVTTAATIGPKTGNTTLVSYRPADLPEPLSVQVYKLVYADPTATGGTREAVMSYTVSAYANFTLPEPIWRETFDDIPEGTLPAGWTTYTPFAVGGNLDLNDPHSDAYWVWVVISRDRVQSITAWNPAQRLVTPEAYINGVKVQSLIENQFAYHESDVRSGSQYAELFSPEVNLSGHNDIYLVYHSIYTQNQDNIAGVEYSIDGGTTWLPVVYMIDVPDIVLHGDGSIDAEATLTTARADTAVYTDPGTGQQVGLSYGAFVKAPQSTWPDLGPYISGRIDDNQNESKRIERFRLPQADNQTSVKLRFFQAGTASWFFGVDNVGLYSIVGTQPPEITKHPLGGVIYAGGSLELTVVATGTDLSYQWNLNDTPIPGATNATLTLANLTTAAAGEYNATVTNDGGSVTSTKTTVVVFDGPIGEDLVAHLKMDGNLDDATGRGNNGTTVGASVFVAGKVGTQAVQLPSNADYVTLGTPADLNFGTTNDFSISFWAKAAAWDGDPSFIGNKDWNSGGNQGYVLATDDDGRIQWNLAGAPGGRKDYDSAGGIFSDGAWHHVVVAFHRTGSASTYVDGLLRDARPLTADQNNVDTPAGLATNIGQDGTGSYGSRFSDVSFDDIGFWRRVITPQEAAALFAAGQAGNDLSSVVVSGSTNAGTLAISLAEGKIVLTWDSGATLQSAPALIGDWSDESAESPFEVDPSGAARFYRLIQ